MTKPTSTREDTVEILADKKLVVEISKSEFERKTGKIITEKKLFKELGILPKNLKYFNEG